jgi:hypothetical protein
MEYYLHNTPEAKQMEIIGDVNITGAYKINNRNAINDTSNYVLETSNILVNRINAKQNTINSTAGQLIIGNGNGITTTNTNLTFSGTTLTATNISGNGSGLTSLNIGNVGTGTLAIANGGTGRTSYTASQILVGSLTQSTELTWNGSTFYVSGNVGIGVAPSTKLHVQGEIYATGNITAYYSDERLKTKLSNIDEPLEIINKLNGFYYIPNDLARIHGITNCEREIGLSAQEVQRVLPEIVKIAPFDSVRNTDGVIVSKSGENYLTMSYERLTPVFVEALKELDRKYIELTKEITLIKEKIKMKYN